MSRRIRSILCQGAATALLIACAARARRSADRRRASLPQWVVRAQERLALDAGAAARAAAAGRRRTPNVTACNRCHAAVRGCARATRGNGRRCSANSAMSWRASSTPGNSPSGTRCSKNCWAKCTCATRPARRAALTWPSAAVHPRVLQAHAIGGEVAADARGRAAAPVELSASSSCRPASRM